MTCDISKAFDEVCHHELVNKLETYGIEGTLLKRFESYSMERTQRVVINGCKSKLTFVLAGVPQESVLARCCS